MGGMNETMGMARALMMHAQARQTEVARNVANADTPGYRARDIAPFDPDSASGMTLRATRPGHLVDSAHSTASLRRIETQGEAAPNGNTVSLEDEMVRAAETRREHDLALAVYQSGLRLMRTASGRRN